MKKSVSADFHRLSDSSENEDDSGLRKPTGSNQDSSGNKGPMDVSPGPSNKSILMMLLEQNKFLMDMVEKR